MTPTGISTEVRRSIDVAVPPEHAFDVFTHRFDLWWNREHHLLPGALRAVGIDPEVGGRLWEESVDGETCVWGRVLTWHPARSFSFSWLIGPDWKVPGPDAGGSRVTVTFTPTATGTHVELVHDEFERHGAGWEGMRDSINGSGGWSSLLQLYSAAALESPAG